MRLEVKTLFKPTVVTFIQLCSHKKAKYLVGEEQSPAT